MIATDHNPAELPCQINHFIGIRAIANNIAKIPNGVILGRSGKNRFESLQIGMNVGDQKCAHVNPSVVLLHCRHFSELASIRHSHLPIGYSPLKLPAFGNNKAKTVLPVAKFGLRNKAIPVHVLEIERKPRQRLYETCIQIWPIERIEE